MNITLDSNCEWTAAVTDWSESSRCKWRRARWLWMMFRIEWQFIAFETPPPFSWRGWGKLHIGIMAGVLCFCVSVSHNTPDSKCIRKWDSFYHGGLNEKTKITKRLFRGVHYLNLLVVTELLKYDTACWSTKPWTKRTESVRNESFRFVPSFFERHRFGKYLSYNSVFFKTFTKL